jgi:hypothetical protein
MTGIRDAWIGRVVRRFGRIGVALVAGVAGLVVFVTTFLVLAQGGARQLALYGSSGLGLATAVGVFSLLDRLGLVPDDSDPPTVLSLNDYKR